MNDDISNNADEVIRISILSLIDDAVTELMKGLVEINVQNSSFQHISSIAVNQVIYRIKIKESPIKLILFQPIAESFTNKLLRRFYDTSCAIFLFNKDDHQSFVAAKVFFQHFYELNKKRNPPAIFIEITNKEKEIIPKEPEILESHPTVSYYTIREKNIQEFNSIIRKLASQYLKTKEHAEESILEKLIHFTADTKEMSKTKLYEKDPY